MDEILDDEGGLERKSPHSNAAVRCSPFATPPNRASPTTTSQHSQQSVPFEETSTENSTSRYLTITEDTKDQLGLIQSFVFPY